MPHDPSPETLSWVKSRQIAYAKAKQVAYAKANAKEGAHT